MKIRCPSPSLDQVWGRCALYREDKCKAPNKLQMRRILCDSARLLSLFVVCNLEVFSQMRKGIELILIYLSSSFMCCPWGRALLARIAVAAPATGKPSVCWE